MLDNFAQKFTLGLIKYDVITENDKDIYIYGWTLLLSNLISYLSIFIVGIISHEVIGTCLYLTFMVLLRKFSGGYHADTRLKCFSFTFLSYGFSLFICKIYVSDLIPVTIGCLMLISAIIIFIFAPVTHPNKPLSDKRKRKNHAISNLIIIIQSTIIISILYWGPHGSYHYMLWAAIGTSTTCIALIVVIIFNPYERRSKV